jgi:hypothetical protein
VFECEIGYERLYHPIFEMIRFSILIYFQYL